MSWLAGLAKGLMNRRDDRVDGLALRTPIAMVDAIALVMALEHSGAHEVRYCPAHIVPPGMQQPRTNLIGHELLCSRMVGPQGPVALEVAPNLTCHPRENLNPPDRLQRHSDVGVKCGRRAGLVHPPQFNHSARNRQGGAGTLLTLYLECTADHLHYSGHQIDERLLAHVSPMG